MQENETNKKTTVKDQVKKEMREEVLKAINGSIKPFRDLNNPWATYAEVKPSGGRSSLCFATDGEDFSMWVRNELAVIKSPPDLVRHVIESVTDAARFGDDERTVALRTARHGGAWFYYLADEHDRVVKVTSEGWTVEDNAPVKFVKTRMTMPMPAPEPGGSLVDLQRFVRVRREEWPLYLTWLLACLTSTGPFPLAAAVGEPGSGKTLAERISSLLIDPSIDCVRALPRSEEELKTIAAQRWLLTFDNVSQVSRPMADALCRMSTGTGTAVAGENDTSLRRPVMVTSIEDLNLESDLLDRTIWLPIPPLSDTDRQAEAALWTEFLAARAKILGALFDALVVVKQRLEAVKESDLPRMADYARIGIAVESTLGLQPGEFLDRYKMNRQAVAEMIVESTPLANLIRLFICLRKSWSGSAQELISTLTAFNAREAAKASSALTSPRRLSGVIRRVAPSLRRVGIKVDFERSSDERTIAIELVRSKTEQEERELLIIGGVENPEESLWYTLRKYFSGLASDAKAQFVRQLQQKEGEVANDGHDADDGSVSA